MCAIFGVGFFRDHQFKNQNEMIGMITRLFREAVASGTCAAGLSIMSSKTCEILRRPGSAKELVCTDEYDKFMERNLKKPKSPDVLQSIIGHCRFPTKGSEYNNVNNHPIVVGHILGVHNGTISNDDELFGHFGPNFLKRAGEVDTEVIFQLIRHFTQKGAAESAQAMKKAHEHLEGSYACAFQNAKRPYNLYLFRKCNPVTLIYYPGAKIVAFATSARYLERALLPYKRVLGVGKEIILPKESGIIFDLYQYRMHKFSLRKEVV